MQRDQLEVNLPILEVLGWMLLDQVKCMDDQLQSNRPQYISCLASSFDTSKEFHRFWLNCRAGPVDLISSRQIQCHLTIKSVCVCISIAFWRQIKRPGQLIGIWILSKLSSDVGPNITGHVQSGYCAVVDGGNTPVGALYLDTPANIIARGNESSNQRRGLGIDASLSSTIFGGSETVQPMSLKLLPCIKTWYKVATVKREVEPSFQNRTLMKIERHQCWNSCDSGCLLGCFQRRFPWPQKRQ